MFLIDTNVCIAIINGSGANVKKRYDVARDEGTPIFLSTLVLFELEFGIKNSRRKDENRAALNAFLTDEFQVVPFGSGDATTAARIRAYLKSLGTPIGPYDLLIAAQALRLGATLVTANTREFIRVPELSLDDWSAGSPQA